MVGGKGAGCSSSHFINFNDAFIKNVFKGIYKVGSIDLDHVYYLN